MTRSPDDPETLKPYTLLLHPSIPFDDPGAAHFVSPAFPPSFRSGHYFSFSFLFAAGGAAIAAPAGGPGYRMAYPNRRTDSGDARPSPHRSVFFHHARSALVCLGVAVRHPAGDSAPGLRIERSGLAVRLAGRCDLRAAAFATTEARYWFAAGGRPDDAGTGRFDDSSLRPPAHCELAFFFALVCCAGSMGRLGEPSEGKLAALDSLVLPRIDVALGKSAWRMAVWNRATRHLRRRCIR